MFIKKFYFSIVMIALMASFSFGQSFIIIINIANKSENISMSDLKNFYKADKQRWPGGEKVKLSIQNLKSKEGKKFLRLVYSMSLNEYNKYWLQKVFKGEAQPPSKMNSVAEVISFVEENPGAIGYIEAGDFTDSVKKLKINGKNAGNKGYPLK